MNSYHTNDVDVVEVFISNLKILICSTYRPPNFNFLEFFKTFNQILIEIEIENSFDLIIITGDYNIDYSYYNHSNSAYILFSDTMTDHGFKQIIRDPTYPNNKDCKSIYDLFFVSDVSFIRDVKVTENISLSCDHKAIICSLNIFKKTKNSKNFKVIDLNSSDLVKFNDELNEINWNKVMSSENIDESYTIFLNKYEEISKKHLSYRVIKLNESLLRVDKNFKKLLVKKRVAYKKFCRENSFKNFCKYHQIFNHISKKLERNFSENLSQIIEKSPNLKCLYKYIKGNNRLKISDCFDNEGSILTDELEIANAFAGKF